MSVTKSDDRNEAKMSVSKSDGIDSLSIAEIGMRRHVASPPHQPSGRIG